MKKLFKTFLTIVIIFALVIIFTFAVVSIRMTGQVKAFDKTKIDISQVADGVYTGHSETDLVKVEVRVTVAEGMIRDIEILKHECGKGRPANEIVNDMIEKNGSKALYAAFISLRDLFLSTELPTFLLDTNAVLVNFSPFLL